MARVTLNRNLTLEARIRTPDDAGGYDHTWAEQGTLWAEIRARGGRETNGEATPVSTTGYRIIVRAAPYGSPSRPVAGQRFREGGRVFAIDAVAEMDQAGRFLTCFAQEKLAI